MTDEELLLTDEQRKGFLRWILILVKTTEMTREDLEYYINLADKAVAGFERTDLVLKDVLLWVKCYQTALLATGKSFVKRRVS